jgi:hypothetical protein
MSNVQADLVARLSETNLADAAARLNERDDLPSFTPATPFLPDLSRKLIHLNPCQAVPGINTESAGAVLSGLLLWNDDLHRSHDLSQNLPSKTGSYLHGIMHRREPDYGNGAYWFRRVGNHPLFPDVAKAAAAIDPHNQTGLIDNKWDPFAMIDACREAASQPNGEVGMLLREIQLAELLLLIDYALDGGVA